MDDDQCDFGGDFNGLMDELSLLCSDDRYRHVPTSTGGFAQSVN